MQLICNRHHELLLAMIIAIVALLLSGIGWAVDASPKDDAYHYMSNGVDDQLYNEWWYFDVVDNDTVLRLVYLLSDPDNISSQRKIQVQAVVMQDGRPDVTGQHNSRGYGGDKNAPMFDIDKSGFSMDEEPNLRVWGEVEDSFAGDPIRWDLVYQPTARPWFAIPIQVQIGRLKNDWIKWLVYMPSAQVTGTLTIGNRTIRLQGTGYHEHAWGRFALGDPQITRASVSVPLHDFCLAFAEIVGEQRVAFLGIEKDGKSITFSDKQIKIKYSNESYAFDNMTAAVFPAAFHVEADNGDYTLDLEVDVQKSTAATIEYQPPLPGIIVFQQVSILQGTLKSKSGEKFSFQDKGFSGFTARLASKGSYSLDAKQGDQEKPEVTRQGDANAR